MFRLRVEPGIELRQLEDRDAAALFALTERNRAYLRQWLPWVDHSHTVEDTRRFITGALSQYHSDRGPNAGIWMDGVIVGSIGCHPVDWANRSCSIGYWLESRRQGQGIITRCCTALIDYLFRDLSLHRVVIQCATGNSRSCSIPERLGFTREGVVREADWVNDRWYDLIVWSLLEQDWRKSKQF